MKLTEGPIFYEDEVPKNNTSNNNTETQNKLQKTFRFMKNFIYLLTVYRNLINKKGKTFALTGRILSVLLFIEGLINLISFVFQMIQADNKPFSPLIQYINDTHKQKMLYSTSTIWEYIPREFLYSICQCGENGIEQVECKCFSSITEEAVEVVHDTSLAYSDKYLTVMYVLKWKNDDYMIRFKNNMVFIDSVSYNKCIMFNNYIASLYISSISNSIIYVSGKENLNLTISYKPITPTNRYNKKVYTITKKVINKVSTSKSFNKIGLLIKGKPGTGKTKGVIRALCEAKDYIKISIDLKSINPTMMQIFENIENKIILLIDDMDVIELSTKNSTTQKLVELLDSDFIHCIVGIINTDSIPSFITREGRFDIKYSVELPSVDERKAILYNVFSELPIKKEMLDKIALATVGYSHAELEALVKKYEIMGEDHIKSVLKKLTS